MKPYKSQGHRQRREVDREDTKRAPDIEHPKEIWTIFALKNDGADQEAREYKEQVDTHPANSEAGEPVFDHAKVMSNDNSQGCHSARAVDVGNARSTRYPRWMTLR